MFKIKKGLGQNFLIDKNKIDEIVKNIPNVGNTNSIFFEVGPGKGALTKEIVKKNKIIAIEIDSELSKMLIKDVENNKNLELIVNDFLKVDLEKLLENYDEVNFVSNLPYYISTKIIFKILSVEKIRNVSIMLQRELVERILAKNKTRTYGRLSVSINTFFEIKKTIRVPKECFYPQPKVDSAFLILKKREINIEKEEYLNFIKDAFSNKRKTLNNSLKNSQSTYINNVNKYFEEKNISKNIRAEEISVEQFLEMWNYIIK